MEILIYEGFPDCAGKSRKQVFEDEQGVQNEFDEKDETATHIVAFDENKTPVATCRVFWDGERDSHVLGRLAVLKEYRGRNTGSALVGRAEQYVCGKGGKCLALHAQCQAAAFYRRLGYIECSGIESEEGCPHVWMRKDF